MSEHVRQIIYTSKAYKPGAAYSQAVKVNDVVYLSGVVGMDKNTMKLANATVEEESRMTFATMRDILQAAGSGLDKLIKVTIMLGDINDFAAVNEVYKEFIKPEFPARSMYAVGKLPIGARLEVEAIGLCGHVRTQVVSE